MLDTPFSPWPNFDVDDAEAVSRVLLSNRVNYWTGTEAREFEKEFAAWAGVRYAVALMNGTVALDLALKALGVGVGDEVIVTPRTFIASVSCVVNAGAVPVFADVEPNSGNVSPEAISAVITPRTKAVICVHLGGYPCDMTGIMQVAGRHGIKVIEDCAQAHGARCNGRSVGSIGHIGAWSFCQDKIVTTGGEGGMVTTNDESLWRTMWSYKDHGKSYEAVYHRHHAAGFRWLHDGFGTNWRMLEMQAVIGRRQLTKLAEWTRLRRRNAAAIEAACGEFPSLRVPTPPSAETGSRHAYYKCYVYTRPEGLKSGWSRDSVIEEITSAGVPCFHGSCSEVYLEKAFDGTKWRPRDRLPFARQLGETSLMFLVHPTLTESELRETCDVLRDVMGRATAA
jgi:dTDP-4-amino-4,6-dideoxygalactose transaminase